MSYCDQASLTLKFGSDELLRIADRDGDGVIDAAVVADACAAASALVDSKLAGVIAVPIAGDGYHKQAANDIARYMLHDNKAPEEVEKRYNLALAWLDNVATGAAIPAPVAGSDDGIGFVEPEPVSVDVAGYD